MSDLAVAFGGLASGAVYALLATGLVLAFRVSGVVNFAHGSAATAAAYVAYALYDPLGPLALLAGVITAAGLGAGTERAVARAEAGGHFAQIAVTLGLFLLLDGLLATSFGADTRNFPHLFEGLEPGAVAPGWPVDRADLSVLAVTGVVALGLALALRTRWGLAISAVHESPRRAAQLGLPLGRLRTATWALAGALGGLAGLLVVPRLFLDPGVMFAPLLKAFAAAVVGGFGSVTGALAAGLALGLLEALVGRYGGPTLQAVLPYVAIFAVLWLSPSGLFVRVARRRL